MQKTVKKNYYVGVFMQNLDKITLVHFGNKHKELFEKTASKVEAWHWVHITNPQKPNLDDLSDRIILISDQDHERHDGWQENILGNRIYHSLYAIIDIVPKGNTPKAFNDLIVYVKPPLAAWEILQTLHRLSSTLSTKREMQLLHSSLKLRTQELAELNQIGVALSAERDPDVLLDMILKKARDITSADAGSLYLIEENPDLEENKNDYWANKQLRFKLAHNDSISSSYNEFVMPIHKKSMAGYTALTGRPLNIANAYEISADSEFQHNRSFDEKMGYRTQSVLCLPMRNHRNEIMGVLQLINRKADYSVRLSSVEVIRRQVIPFNEKGVELASSLAGQAAVSIENMQLYEEIKNVFEGFIIASVHAIEQRDPTTFGHSQRVAELTVGLAEQIDRTNNGPYKNISYNRDDIQQIKYAGLLHDFGKIGVRENVLIKAKKLYPEQLDQIRMRFQLITKSMEIENYRQKLALVSNNGKKTIQQEIKKFDREIQKRKNELENYLYIIEQANEPQILQEKVHEKIVRLGRKSFKENGNLHPYLTSEEIEFLSISKGSLSAEERHEIESHVTHTYNFLKRIPWSSNLKMVPEIAYGHHEKLNGKGYPRGLLADQIPLPARMMTIADIFDALTAWDRPYKKAVPVEKALDIILSEVKAGQIDPVLFNIFLEAKIYQLVQRPEEKHQ
jgi:HD-GYP domain-containing protein (c-di-GMP phosphodiesterase class II)